MHPIEKDADVYTLEEFIKMVEEGCFIDYDGYGFYATATEESTDIIYPSHISGKTDEIDYETMTMKIVECEKKLNRKYSHVVWYNR